MDFIVQNLVPYLLLYKYLTIFVISFSAAFILPIPSGNLLMIASAFSKVGYFNIFWIILISIFANILGDNLGYFIARKYGQKVLSNIGFKRILNSQKFINLENKYRDRPGFIIFASRFEVISTLSINLLSGLSKTPYRKFLLYESIGTVSQVCFYGFIGYSFYYGWESIGKTIGGMNFIIGIIVVVLVIVLVKRILKRRKI